MDSLNYPNLQDGAEQAMLCEGIIVYISHWFIAQVTFYFPCSNLKTVSLHSK
jgi:hypothetical protein